MFLALAAQAQTDSGSSSGTVPTLTIVSSSATAAEGDEVTYTITASSAPSSALPVVVQVRAHGEVMDTRTVAEVLLPAGATTVTLRLEEFTDEIDESPVNVTLTLAAGAGYSVGDPSEATVSIDYPSISGTQATPTPAPAVSPPDAPSGVSISSPTINSFTVSWTAETGKSYRVEREAAYLFKYRVWQMVADNVTGGSFTESGLPCDLYYVYRVQAKVAGSAFGAGTRVLGPAQACQSSPSSGARTVRAVGTPMPQLRIVTDNPEQDRIQIRLLLYGSPDEVYNPIRNMDMFQVDRSERYAGSGNPVFPSPAIRREERVAEFDWGGLECGSSYYFRARGHGNGESDGFTDEWGKWSHEHPREAQGTVHGSTRGCTLSLSLPPAPSNVYASINPNVGGTGYGVELVWDLLSGAASFKLERSDDDGVTWPTDSDHVSTGITGTQHSVSGLVCDNDYVFRISAYGDGKRYLAEDGPTRLVTRYGPITDRSARSDEGDFPCTRPAVSVIPMPGRKARIEWEYRDGSTFEVEARRFIPGADANAGWKAIAVAGTSDTSTPIGLDGLLSTGLGGHKQGFEIRVRATTVDGTNTDYTKIILIDTPIVRADGASSGGNQVSLRWTELDDVLGVNRGGDKVTYAIGPYSARIRKFDESSNGVPHTDKNWEPDQFVDEDGRFQVLSSNRTVTGLETEEVYAIQLRGSVTRSDESTPTFVYAARDVYVWPSNRPVTDGDRVASFPLEARLKKDAQGNITYAYHICDETFTFTNRWSDWEKLIVHAMGQWQLATDNLITMSYLETEDCANYDDVIEAIERRIVEADAAADISKVRRLVTGLSYFGSFTAADKSKNEIILINQADFKFSRDAVIHRTFSDLAKYIGLGHCAFGTAFGCRIPNRDSPGSDILLNYEKFITDSLDIPGGRTSTAVPPKRGDAPFNNCASEKEENNQAYITVVHEGGHAVGIGGASVGGPHPSEKLVDSIVNPNDMAGCTPNPFDIMVIYALYQTY